jgi:HK97 family phage portal protein
MKLFGLDLNFSRRRSEAPAAVQRSCESYAEAWLRAEEPLTGPGLHNAYEQVVWVYRAINVLAEQVANVPFRFSIGRAEGEDLITTGPLADFYARPHPHINRFQYWELRVMWLMLRGECFRVPLFREGRGGRRVLERVLLLDPACFQHIVDDHELVGWRYTGFGPETPLAAQVFLPEEVWFEKLPNPLSFWRGLSPLHVADTAAHADFAAGRFMRELIENNGDIGLVVRLPLQSDPRQREQILAAMRERKRRAGTSDRPLVLWNGAEVVRPKLSTADLQFLENRKFTRAEICAAIGVPEEIVTTTDTAKYDVMEGARLNFIENRVAPLCRRLEAEEDALVKSIDERAVGWFDLDSLPLLQQARRNRLAAARTGFEMGVPFNELNRVFDLGFKALPWGEAGYVALNLQKVGEGNAPVPPEAQSVESAEPPPAKDLEPGVLERAAAFLNELEQARSLSPQREFLRNKVTRHLFEQRCRALARAAETKGEAALELAAEDERLRQGLEPVLTETLKAGITLLAQLGPAPELPPDAVEQFVRWQQPELHSLNERMLAELKGTLAEGRKLREQPEQLAARIRAAYNSFGETEAERLAQSLVSNVSEASRGFVKAAGSPSPQPSPQGEGAKS